MPFASAKQRRWMFANSPAMAHRWAHETVKRHKKRKRKRG